MLDNVKISIASKSSISVSPAVVVSRSLTEKQMSRISRHRSMTHAQALRVGSSSRLSPRTFFQSLIALGLSKAQIQQKQALLLRYMSFIPDMVLY